MDDPAGGAEEGGPVAEIMAESAAEDTAAGTLAVEDPADASTSSDSTRLSGKRAGELRVTAEDEGKDFMQVTKGGKPTQQPRDESQDGTGQETAGLALGDSLSIHPLSFC